MLVELESIPNSFEMRLGIPRPDWAVIGEWVDKHVHAEHLQEAWTEIGRQWLEKLRCPLAAGYGVRESEEFLLLSVVDVQASDRLLKWCEYYRQEILDALSGVAKDDGYGKHVVLAFRDLDTYYDYIADFYPDVGEFGMSSGMCLYSGYVHIAMCTKDASLERTIAHELIHAMLAHLPLPLWLNEGVTQVVEDLVIGASNFTIDHALARRHRDYWTADSIHTFWSGESFYCADEGQELSYSLAQVLFRNLLADYGRKAFTFVSQANFADSGESAFVEICRVSLADRIAQFLGAGEWRPRSDYSQVDGRG